MAQEGLKTLDSWGSSPDGRLSYAPAPGAPRYQDFIGRVTREVNCAKECSTLPL